MSEMSTPDYQFTGDPETSRHERDVNINADSVHHTLGKGTTQAAAGDHTHKAKDVLDLADPGDPLIDHQLLNNRSDPNAHTQYVKTSDLNNLGYVAKTGDVMSGDLSVDKSAPRLTLDGPAETGHLLETRTDGIIRWALGSNPTTEAGGDTGSDFTIFRFNDAGGYLDAALEIIRSSGKLRMSELAAKAASLGSGRSIISKSYVDAKMQSGKVYFPSGSGVIPITFAVPFLSPPDIVTGILTGSTSVDVLPWAAEETLTGCNIHCFRGNTTPTWLSWHATGEPDL